MGLGYQLFGAPLSIQHIIEFFWEVANELFLGIVPLETADRIEVLAEKIWVKLVKGPGPLPLPAAWQLAIAQEEEMIGDTSAANALFLVGIRYPKEIFIE